MRLPAKRIYLRPDKAQCGSMRCVRCGATRFNSEWRQGSVTAARSSKLSLRRCRADARWRLAALLCRADNGRQPQLQLRRREQTYSFLLHNSQAPLILFDSHRVSGLIDWLLDWLIGRLIAGNVVPPIKLKHFRRVRTAILILFILWHAHILTHSCIHYNCEHNNLYAISEVSWTILGHIQWLYYFTIIFYAHVVR